MDDMDIGFQEANILKCCFPLQIGKQIISLKILKTSLLFSVLYNLLIKTFWTRKIKFLFQIWQVLWKISDRKGVFVKTKVHGYPAIVPSGHWYLLVLKKYKKFNTPLVSLLDYTETKLKRKINIVDVGSAVGDTVLLLEGCSKNRLNTYVCVDGDDEYIDIAKENLRFAGDRVRLIHTLISDNYEPIGKIIKNNPTTGTASSEDLLVPKTLDSILESESEIDLVKIDIDGYDGRAISGMSETLKKFKPNIIFEWNVPLFEKTNNDLFQPFKVLNEVGYGHFFWFDNFGNFLFYQKNIRVEDLEVLSIYSKNNFMKTGFHYDIVSIFNDNDFINFAM